MEENGTVPRFVADVMLGRLARWLRAFGYDTFYSTDMHDDALVRLALAQDRILLTRDVELARRRGLHVVLIADDHIGNQLRELVRVLKLSAEQAFSRCIDCNTVLVELDRTQAGALVPPYVFSTQNRFRRCPKCGKVYWRGTHWQRMRAELESARAVL